MGWGSGVKGQVVENAVRPIGPPPPKAPRPIREASEPDARERLAQHRQTVLHFLDDSDPQSQAMKLVASELHEMNRQLSILLDLAVKKFQRDEEGRRR